VCPSDDGDLALLAGLSYAWREALEVFDPSAALSGRDLRTAGPADLLMVFEGFPGLHQPDRLNAAALDTSVRTCTVAQLEADLERVVQ
jgi:hypothetical protein